MKTIIITGPSGSGKSFLANKLSKLFKDSILIKTDSYYRDNILIQFLSIFKLDIYDRIISLKKKEIKKILRSLYRKKTLVSFSHYDFKRKKSSENKIKIQYKSYNQFLIIEGIFSHRLDLKYHETINIVCNEEKEICYNRRLRRDQIERGRNPSEVNKKFNKSWSLFYQHINNFLHTNNVIHINPLDKTSYNKLVYKLQILKDS